MAKSVFYFKHDYNASQDPKLMRLQREIGTEGTGIYWMLVERLGPASGHKLPFDDETLTALEWDMHIRKELLKDVIEKYDLFKIEDGMFYSERLLRDAEDMDVLRNKRAEAGRKGGMVKPSDKQNASNASSTACENDKQSLSEKKEKNQKKIIKEIKESKEIEENNSYTLTEEKDKDKNKERAGALENFFEGKVCWGEGHTFSEHVTDEEYVQIVRRYMGKCSIDPTDDAEGLIEMMIPNWVTKYGQSYIDCKADAAAMWQVKRERKYIKNAPKANLEKTKNIDEYLKFVMESGVRDKWMFKAYRHFNLNGRDDEIHIIVCNSDAMEYITKKHLKALKKYAKEKYGREVKLFVVG